MNTYEKFLLYFKLIFSMGWFCFQSILSTFTSKEYVLHHELNFGERWWSGYVSASQSKGRMFEAHHDPCSLLGGEATLPSPEK